MVRLRRNLVWNYYYLTNCFFELFLSIGKGLAMLIVIPF